MLGRTILAFLLCGLLVGTAGATVVGVSDKTVYVQNTGDTTNAYVGCWQSAAPSSPSTTCGMTTRVAGQGGPSPTWTMTSTNDCFGGRIVNALSATYCTTQPTGPFIVGGLNQHQVYTSSIFGTDVTLTACKQEPDHRTSCGMSSKVVGLPGLYASANLVKNSNCAEVRALGIQIASQCASPNFAIVLP